MRVMLAAVLVGCLAGGPGCDPGALSGAGSGKDTGKGSTAPAATGPSPFEELTARAEKGKPGDMRELADAYRDGKGTDRDVAKAFAWYLKAAEAGELASMVRVAAMLEAGEGTAKDAEAAAGWYVRAAGLGVPRAVRWVTARAEADDPAACRALGLDALRRAKAAIDEDERARAREQARTWLARGAAAGDAQAATERAWMEMDEPAPKWRDARRWMRQGVEAKVARALVGMGDMHWSGHGLSRNPGKAVNYYQQAADAGDAEALGRLGMAYLTGLGVTKDQAKGLELLKRGADGGSAETMCGLAGLYLTGTVVERDLEAARAQLRKAIAAGSIKASEYLGDVELFGVVFDDLRTALREDVKRYALAKTNRSRAVPHYRQAARGRRLSAMKKLGDLYAQTLEGLEPNLTKALQWYRPALKLLLARKEAGKYTAEDRKLEASLKEGIGSALFDHGDDQKGAMALLKEAAEMGDGEAMYGLGVITFYGVRDHEWNPEAAYAWFLEAAKTGHKFAAARVEQLGRRKKLDPVRTVAFVEARAQANDFRAQKMLPSFRSRYAAALKKRKK